jgi:hypothetical protein
MRTLGLLLAIGCAAAGAEAPLDLSGEWRFAIDRNDSGLAESWHARPLEGKVRLPGSLMVQRIGDPVTVDTKWIGGIVDKSYFTDAEYEPYRKPGNVKVPFWLQPETYYAGAAWYQREIEIPADWKGRRAVLSLERPHWETRAWIDGRCVGTNNALATPHDHDLGLLAPGKHTLTIRVDNRMVVDVGENSHSVSDHTQGNWNGIVGRVELRSTPPVWIDDVQVFPDAARKTARVRVTVRVARTDGAEGAPAGGVRCQVSGRRKGGRQPPVAADIAVAWTGDTGVADGELPLGPDAMPWDEFSPNLVELTATLSPVAGSSPLPASDSRSPTPLSHPPTPDSRPPTPDSPTPPSRLPTPHSPLPTPDSPLPPPDSRRLVFGLRDFAAQGTQFAINGRPVYIRGTLDCCIFPKTGHPPTDVAEWKRIIGVAKAHGLNLIRFHSWCPPEAAFAAADELGFYFHVEASSWANQSTTIGDGKPVDAWVIAETERILKAYGNHPSFVLMAYGNEPAGKNHKAWLAAYVDRFRARDPRRLWTSGAGWPELPENEWHCVPQPRIQAWGGGLKSRINAKPPETMTDYRDFIAARGVPVVSHEIGQWCVYPNFDEIAKYTGPLKPRNFEIFRDTLAANHMGDQARAFLMASGKLQALCYKEEIESALRTPGMGGFQLLDLHDFPGQGTALVGVLDPFWESKGYITPEEYARFCGPVVPLARMAKRVWTSGETFKAAIEIAQFGPAPITNGAVAWSLRDAAGAEVARGHSPARVLPVGLVQDAGAVEIDLKPLPTPARYRLVVSVGEIHGLGARGVAENDWDLWVYPPATPADPPAGVHVTASLDDAALAKLKAGGTVLLCVDGKRVKGDVAIGFSSIFWNTAWTRNQPPHTLGILCDPRHPVFASFPTESHSNWQWWELVHGSGAMVLDGLPPGLRPLVQPIDTWFKNRRLGLLFEAKAAGGKLVVCSMDLDGDLANRPVARQLRASLFAYLAGASFSPKVEVTPDQVRALVRDPRPLDGLGAVAKASSDQNGYEAARAIDGNPGTMWHSTWEPAPLRHPHALTVTLGKTVPVRGVTVLPRQDRNPNGNIREYEVFTSTDGTTWGEPAAKGSFDRSVKLKTVTFERPVAARAIRLVAKSGFENQPWAAVAEFDIVTE